MGTESQTSILADIKYHDYAVLIAHIDAERFTTSKRSKDPMFCFNEPCDIFEDRCDGYREFLENTINKFKKTIGFEEELDFDPFLYNPACFVAFGNNDNIAIVAVDDFEAAARLSSLVDVSVRQTCLAFCPELKSLGLKAAKYKDVFCELEDIYKDPYAAIKRLSGTGLASPDHFFRGKPLLAVSYFKLNGMSVLGPGLFVQQYAYKVMADRIKDTLQELSDDADKFKDILPGGQDDVDSFRCLFLDPQGWADIATLMFCRNCSVITTVVAALRFLTLGDLYIKSDEQVSTEKRPGRVTLKDAVKSFGVHKALANIAENKAAADSLLGENHLFISTYTCLGIYRKAFNEDGTPEKSKEYDYNGVVIADTNLNIGSGHFLEAKRASIEKEKTIAKYKTELDNLSREYAWYMLGHSDFLYQQLVVEDRDVSGAVNLTYLINQIKKVRESSKSDDDEKVDHLATDILEVCTDLRIPIPILPKVMRGVEYNEHIEIRSILEGLRENLFINTPGMFNLKKLSDSMNIMRLPSPLSTSIDYLYTDFANYLSDPFLFESVLDLCDIFTAFYNLLTEELPQSLKSRLVGNLEETLGHKEVAGLKLEKELLVPFPINKFNFLIRLRRSTFNRFLRFGTTKSCLRSE